MKELMMWRVLLASRHLSFDQVRALGLYMCIIIWGLPVNRDHDDGPPP